MNFILLGILLVLFKILSVSSLLTIISFIVELANMSTKTVSSLMIKFDKFKNVVGNIYEVDGYKVLPIYHPSPISPKGYKDNIPIFEKLKNKIFVGI